MSEQQTLTFPATTAPRIKPSARRVLLALAAEGGTGTAYTAMRRLGQFSNRADVSKRLGELEAAGLVVRVGSVPSPTGVKGASCTVFALTDVGQQQATEAMA